MQTNLRSVKLESDLLTERLSLLILFNFLHNLLRVLQSRMHVTLLLFTLTRDVTPSDLKLSQFMQIKFDIVFSFIKKYNQIIESLSINR